MINSFYKKYKNELMLHINDEEKNVFPYIIELVKNQKSAIKIMLSKLLKRIT